jgi:hypothetical protein
MEVYPFIKEGVINMFPEHQVHFRANNEEFIKSKLFIQTVDLPYEGEGEEGTNP